ncbi:hypothetical protein [Glaciihabitans tibetensis]|uniref:hypothetical protein n=1 Tax=Glaciihabitans tibetensis TaxID=1266600 RepID=UPI0011B293E8|nr:hypothetical protein [Glaciihabitans tibetensis]
MTVPSASGTTNSGVAGGLASTGLGNVVTVLVVAALLLLAGTLVFVVRPRLAARTHKRQGAGAALGLLLVALVAGGVVLTPQPASAVTTTATATQSCELFTIDDVVRATSAGAGALPGDTVEPLAFTISNPTRFPITVVVDTTVTLDPAGAAALYLAELSDGGSAVLTRGPLDAVPSTAAITIAAGAELTVSYALTLDPAATNAVQGSVVAFDSLISASSE